MNSIKYCKILPIFLITLLFIASTVSAIQFESDSDIHISNIHKIDDDLLAAGNIIIIDGEINGDVIATGSSITNNGIIEHSISVVGEKFKHSGEILGSARFLGNEAAIEGYVGRSVLAVGGKFYLENRGVIEKDLVVYGQSIYLKGTVNENAELNGKTITITGTVNGDLLVKGEHIKIQAPAMIVGDFTYESDNQAIIDISSGVTINGETTWNLPDADQKSPYSNFIITTAMLAAAFLFGLILIGFCKKYLLESLTQLQTKFSTSLAYGFVTVLLSGVIAVFFLIAIVMMLVSFFMISGENTIAGMISLSISIVMLPISSLMTVCGGVLLYSGKIILAILVGFYIVRLVKKDAALLSSWQMLIGLIVLTLIFAIPYIGFLLYILASIVGAGAFVQGIRNCRRTGSSTNSTTVENQ